jgi:tryptophan 2,3-dioxygenase
MPFFDTSEYWQGWEQNGELHPFWQKYADTYAGSLTEGEKFNLDYFKEQLLGDEKKPEWSLSPKARRAALFIMLYRDYPLLQMPYNLMNVLLEIDNTLSAWRYRHMNMVHRMIGTRTGTGGSTGKDYLRGALNSHYIFSEFAGLTSFLIERNKLPKLSPALRARLGFDI